MSWRTMIATALLLGVASAPGWGRAAQASVGAKVEKHAAADEQRARNYFTDLPLITHDGEQVHFYTDVLKDKVVLINFVYTNCTTACPLLTHKLTLVRDMVEGQLGDPIHFVTISLDPARDTPAALKAFARRHHADHRGWVFLTGASANVNGIIKKLGQYSPDLESHSTLMLAGNVRTAHWMKIPPTMPPAAIAEKLRLLAEESPTRVPGHARRPTAGVVASEPRSQGGAR